MKTCIACGMPLREKTDYPNGDEGLDYCVHCARPDGTMHSFEEKKAGMAAFLVRTQGLDPQVAERAALEQMKNLPAWREHFS